MKAKAIYILMFAYALLLVLSICFFNGTGDSGDSIYHYQYARFAPHHRTLFFSQWAKPLYVLLVSPFAQLGFVGVKIFNSLVAVATVFLTFKIAAKCGLQNAILAPVLLICSPLYLVLILSGLTEPLFALALCLGIYFALTDKLIASSVIISFLPFIRSEGILILAIFALYFLIKKQLKLIPLLFTGLVVYSIAGYFIYHDFFWMINTIPYARLSSNYGNGPLFHFVEQLIYVVGVPIFILFWIGFFKLTASSIKGNSNSETVVLVFGGFLIYFIAHSIFWYLGIFNSMGLKRVLIGVLPLISIVSLIGLNFIIGFFFKRNNKWKIASKAAWLLYIVIFPFTSNPAAINLKKDLCLSEDQYVAIQVKKYIAEHVGYNHRFVFSLPYLAEVLNIDPFDETKHVELSKESIRQLKPNDVIIWENWYAVVEQGINRDFLNANTNLRCIYTIDAKDSGREVQFSVYKVIDKQEVVTSIR